MTKKIQISESDLYNIIKQVLLEQEEEENVWYTDEEDFKFRLFKAFGGDSEKFAKYHNKFYEKIVVNGYLDLSNTPITSLPDNLYVGGYLDLRETQITSLPDNLHVGGYLDLVRTPITSLGDNLSVGGDLDLRGTQITSLPDDLAIKENIYINGTPLNDNDELVREYIAKGYKLYR
jgi:hypothetical protein